ncbi:hypothetical protein HF82_08290 [Limosilactobacillus reuteri]|nr:DUF6056 family protein [Limosilactobacillus reuteri]KEQ19992.1 hypothetical protein HF82_08290 [Limosilactobacillus reuteri]
MINLSYNKKRILYFIYIFVIWLGMLWWNLETPLMNDDLYVVKQSFMTIIHEGINDYLSWNGRFWGQTFFRLSLMGGEVASSIINSVVFIILMIEIFSISKCKIKKNIYFSRLIGVSCFILLFVPGFVSIFIWRAGAGNYMDSLAFDYAFLFFFLNEIDMKERKLVYGILLILCGFIAGMGNENTSGGLLLISTLVLIRDLYSERRISGLRVSGLISAYVGFFCLLLSPGNKMRLRISHPDYLKQSLFERVLNGLITFKDYIVHQPFMIGMIVLCIIFMVLAYAFWKDSVDYLLGTIFIIGGLASIFVMIISPEGINESRTYGGAFTFLIVGFWTLVPIKWPSLNMRKAYYILLVICSLFCIFRVTKGIHNGLQFSGRLSNRYNYIERKCRTGAKTIKVSPLTFNPNNNYSLESSYIELSNTPHAFPNQGYEFYLKANKVLLR